MIADPMRRRRGDRRRLPSRALHSQRQSTPTAAASRGSTKDANRYDGLRMPCNSHGPHQKDTPRARHDFDTPRIDGGGGGVVVVVEEKEEEEAWLRCTAGVMMMAVPSLCGASQGYETVKQCRF